jgi:iron complex outermembrane receptor protein
MYNIIINSLRGVCLIKKISASLILSASVLAGETLNLEDDFLESLNSASKIATKNKLNVEKTTSLITTLQGKKLQKLGVDSVYDALRYIPGIELSKESSGVKNVIFRGSVTKGEVKFLVDGVEINNTYRASFYYYLDLPIELVSRIEVLRGPSSVVYGSGAISGVINIVTKASQNSDGKLFISGGSYSYTKGGAILNLSKESYKLSADAYYQMDDKEIDSSDQRTLDYSAGINLKVSDFELNARVKNSDQGNSHGLFNVVDLYEDRYYNKNSSWFSELKYNQKLSQNNSVNIALNYIQYSQNIEADAGAIDLESDYKENSYGTEIKLTNTSIENNNLITGFYFKHTHTKETDLYGHPVESNIVKPDLERSIYSIFLKNNYLLNDDINIDIGLRYDDYSDFGDNISPDLGLVYRTGDNLSLKLRHSYAFRAPSWTELYGLSGDETLEAETSSNTEFGAIYRYYGDNKISLNLYHSKIKDYIYKYAGSDYSQDNELYIRGAELESLFSPVHNLEFSFQASYADAKDIDDQTVDEITRFLTTFSAIYTNDYGVTFGSTLRYKNTKDMDNSVILDQSVSYNYKDFNINLIAKNLFDSDVHYYDNAHDKTNPIVDAQRVVLLKTSWMF